MGNVSLKVLEKSLKFLSKKGTNPDDCIHSTGRWSWSVTGSNRFTQWSWFKVWWADIIAEVEGVSGCYLGFIVWGRSPEWPKAMSFLAGSGGMPPAPEIFWNEYALRCNLVRFETQFWEMLQWYFISFFSRDLVPCHIVPLAYLLHVHWPRRVWMIFPI